MQDSTCYIEGCDRSAVCQKMCKAHYMRYRNGARGDRLNALVADKRQNVSKICTVEGCSRPTTANDLCRMHYQRVRAWGHSGPAENLRPGAGFCIIEGCGGLAHSRGWCPMHYQRWRSTGDPGTAEFIRAANGSYSETPCSVDGCDRLATTKGWCNTHYGRARRGEPLDAPIQVRGITRRTKASGYVQLKVPDHPNADKEGWVLEHRKVMQDQLGRPLRDFENVHHINGIRDDNRPENLELWTKAQPAGQRPADLAAWVRDNYPELLT